MDPSPLVKIGLSQSEIVVYLELLKHGASPASLLAKRTGVNRSHIYDKLSALKQKGLVSEVQKGKILWFNASPPEQLLDYLREVQGDVQSLLPELMRMQKGSSADATVELFQGKEGMKTVFRDILNTKNDYCVIGEEGKFQELFPIYIQQFLRDVQHFKMRESIMSKESLRGKIPLTKNTKIRYLPDKYISPVMIVVYGDKTAIWIWTEPMFTILVRSKDVASSFKTYFDILWGVAKS